jgi:SAM-dependent methyltransferase
MIRARQRARQRAWQRTGQGLTRHGAGGLSRIPARAGDRATVSESVMNVDDTIVRYGRSEDAWRGVKDTIASKIVSNRAKTILEIGAGANPLFAEDFLVEHSLDYTALDISADELKKAPACYGTIVADICSPTLKIGKRFDFVFSRMLAEHVTDGTRLHRNVFELLAPGGRAFHFFPTMWAPPFVVNRILPERLAAGLLHMLQSGREQSGRHAKFPAYYSGCRGPTRSRISSLRSLGYRVESYEGFFGHRDYYRKLPPVQRLHDSLVNRLIAKPSPWFTSFAYVTLQRPR